MLQQLISMSGDYIEFDIGDKKDQKIKIVGTHENPYFCGKDVCEILEYKDIKCALQEVKEKHKKDLKTLKNELGGVLPPNSFGLNNLKHLTYHSGKAVYISEPGLYSLILACKLPNATPFKAFVDQFFYDLRYKAGIMDIFAFMKDKKVM